MKNLFFMVFFFPIIVIGQQDYELEFNSGTQDYIEIPNVSSLIANKFTFSISGWVYPESNTVDHSGFMGFRNEIDADFYLLQLQNTNDIEARFRNSTGVYFDVIAYNAISLNQWQHLAFTYDGSYIRLYKDGYLLDSTAANGTISQINEPFRLGSLDWLGTGFYMNGRLDEIRIWDIKLSQSEISNWMCAEVNNSHPSYNNLKGYWRLNSGLGITIYDQISGNNGTFFNNPIWQNTTNCFNSTPPARTYVPDDNFENYLEANGMGDGIVLNDSVLTSAIDTVTSLDITYMNISDLTGIEDFNALYELQCYNNNLSTLDVSANSLLSYLHCYENNLTSLDVSNNNLVYLACRNNAISILDINTNLSYLICNDNLLTSLDLTPNLLLRELKCNNNNLTTLDVRNGNNTIITDFNTINNPNLSCINVDSSTWSTTNWLNIDPQHYFSNDCSAPTSIKEYYIERKLVKVIDILGRGEELNRNTLFFHIYNDGSVEKKIITE
tara:strand:- start:2957 stop:4447 length:1491 start_codon:yes stop_codon:yes gene_type:complete